MNGVQPVYGETALVSGNCLVIGDLHIGLESHLRAKGFNVLSRTHEMLDRILSMSGDADRLIVLGDVKDSVPGSTKQEYSEIPVFFDRLCDAFSSVDIVRGNHDTELEEFVPGRVSIRPATGLVVDDVGFVHGHTWPSAEVMRCRTLVMAHNHPSVLFKDGIGRQTTEPCWVRGRFNPGPSDRYDALPDSLVITPAFNRMLGGSPVNSRDEGLLGPILNNDLIDIDSMGIFLLDGLYLGTRGDLLVDTGRHRTGRRDPQTRAKYS